jgi:hypothetical protein
MYAFTKPPQDDHLRLSPGLLFSGLKLHKLDCVQVDGQQRIVDRIRQLSHISRFVPQELVERVQQPDIIDLQLCASWLRHDYLPPRKAARATSRLPALVLRIVPTFRIPYAMH